MYSCPNPHYTFLDWYIFHDYISSPLPNRFEFEIQTCFHARPVSIGMKYDPDGNPVPKSGVKF